MAEIPLDHFFNVVCRDVDNALLHKAIIHFVTTSSQYPRLRRAAKAWQPSTPVHHEFKRVMLVKRLRPLTSDQVASEPEVAALMRTLQDWLRTNWYRKGEIMISRQAQLATKEPTHG